MTTKNIDTYPLAGNIDLSNTFYLILGGSSGMGLETAKVGHEGSSCCGMYGMHK
jgi:hypothetical protein